MLNDFIYLGLIFAHLFCMKMFCSVFLLMSKSDLFEYAFFVCYACAL